MDRATKLKECRAKIEQRIFKTMSILDPTHVNTNKFKAAFSQMKDEEFIKFMKEVAEDPDTNLYFEIKFFETPVEMDRAIEAAKLFKLKLYDKVGFREFTKDGRVVYSQEDILIGIVFVRKLSQTSSTKNKFPKDAKNFDPNTNQVTGKSKAARVSDMETYSLIAQDVPNIIKEMHGPRGGDAVSRDEMIRIISSGAPVRLEDLDIRPENKKSLVSASDILLAAGIESNLVNSPGYLLPRTKQLREVKGVKRK